MLGIDKETMIRALQKANIKIFTTEDVDDLFNDLGRECHYNDDQEVEFNDVDDFVKRYEKDEEEEEKPASLPLTDGIIKSYGPSIVCFSCSSKDICNNSNNCPSYLSAKQKYEELKR